MPWQYSSVLPGNILRFHGIAPAEKYTSFKFFVRFYEKGETLPDPSKAENEAAPVKKDKPTAEKSAVPVKSAAPAAGQKAEQAPAKTEMKKMETAVKTDVKKVEAKAEAEVRKAETAVKADVKKAETKAEAEVRKIEKELKKEEGKLTESFY